MLKSKKMLSTKIFLCAILLSACGIKKPVNLTKNSTSTIYNQMSEDLLVKLKANENILDIQTKLVEVSDKQLYATFKTDEQKKSFWLNIYNAYIIATLKRSPELYKDRGSFFSKKQVNIAGHLLSFDEIENGMIRKSQYKFGLGYIRTPFVSDFERKLRVNERDYRIHFALNCGANSCPPVRIYKVQTIDAQLENTAKLYLQKNSTYNKKTNVVTTSSLTKWFKGDFGATDGVKQILKGFKIIPQESNPKIEYGNYDWTLNVNNFAL
jgi:hypothetical protein